MDNGSETVTNAETLNEVKEGLNRILSHLDSDLLKADDKGMKDKGAYKGDYADDKNVDCDEDGNPLPKKGMDTKKR